MPSGAALAHLAERLGPLAVAAPGPRWTPAERWHITLGFFGDDDDEDRRTAWLRRRVAGCLAPTLRLAGAGTFGPTLWVGVHPVGDEGERVLARLAQAAGAGHSGVGGFPDFRPHLSVARSRPGRSDPADLVKAFDDYSGPEFTAPDVVLMRSERGPSGSVYLPVDRVSLDTPESPHGAPG